MMLRDLLAQAPTNRGPTDAVAMQPEHANKLLQMIVDDGVIQPGIDVFKRVGQDRMVWVNDAIEGLEIGGRDDGRRMHAKTAKIANNESLQFARLEVEPGQGILRMGFKRDAVCDDRGEKRLEKEINKPEKKKEDVSDVPAGFSL